MNFKNYLKIIMLFCINTSYNDLQGTVKVFVNDSKKNLIITVYDTQHNIVSIQLTPGAIQELFIEGQVIDKIVIQNEKHMKKSLAAMAHQVLRKDSSAINENMIYIIHQNTSITMYKASAPKDNMLKAIDTMYVEQGRLPTIAMTIDNKKGNDLVTKQNISYALK